MNKLISAVLIAAIFLVSPVMAQKKTEEVKIKTSAQCEMCKTRIETALAYEKGIVKSDLNVETKVLTVIFKTGKTTVENIRKALNAVGYDADETLAVKEAYSKLPACCKKPDDPEHIGH